VPARMSTDGPLRVIIADDDPLARRMIKGALQAAGDGLLATRQLLKANPDQRVVVLTGGDEGELGLLALRAGAVGFLSKHIDIEALPRALQGVRGGEAAVSRDMTRRLIERFRETSNGSSGLRPIKSPLTAREWEVIELLKPDRSPDDVARTLVLSTETVRSHIKNVMRKLDVHSRADAVAATERLRIGTSDPTG
jgi:NarL family two-component system response regulator LiaR